MSDTPQPPPGGAKIDDATALQGIAAIDQAIAVIQAEELPPAIVAATQLIEEYAEEHDAKYSDINSLQAALRVLRRRAGLGGKADD